VHGEFLIQDTRSLADRLLAALRAQVRASVVGVVALLSAAGSGCALTSDDSARTYVVQPHDTVYSIAWRHDLDYRDLARWNRIGPDYRIVIGQVLVLGPTARPHPSPGSAKRIAAPPPAPSAAGKSPGAQQTAPPGPAGAPGPPEAVAASAAASAANPGPPLQWFWPTTHASAPRPVPGGGILLLGELGQPIRAASSGRVVYVGNGLRGYGNLIIIKHGENLLSAYAHTRELEVREGQQVAGGEVIAQMGTGPRRIAALYFEIRLNGKPVDPLSYLPKI